MAANFSVHSWPTLGLLFGDRRQHFLVFFACLECGVTFED